MPRNRYTVTILLKWLWSSSKGNRLQAFLNAIIGLLGVVVSLSSVWAVQRAIDIASHNVAGNIYIAVFVMALLILSDFALSVASIWVQNLLGIKAQNRMQQKLLERILKSEWKGKESHHSGDILNRLELDVNNVVDFITVTIPDAISTLALFIGAFSYLLSMDWRLAVVIVVMFPIFLLCSKIYIRQMRGLTSEVRGSDSKVQSILQETIQHRMLLKTLEGEDMAVDRLEAQQRELRHNVIRRTKFSVFSSLTIGIGFSFGYLIAFTWAAVRLSLGTLTFGGMTAFLQLVNKIQRPARQLTRLVPTFVSVLTAAERLLELQETPLEQQGKPIKINGPIGIEVDNVSFKYDDGDENTINDLSVDFKPNTCTAILGETGVGKTTLIRLLLALLKPTKGNIYIYNDTGKKEMTSLMRNNFSYVPQGNTLMSGTIRDNLKMGNPMANSEDMKDALIQSCADFVFELPDGLDTMCTELGGGLSEGQAQRISIARSLLRNSSIILFDEATSALDTETEKQLLNNILKQKNKTIIFITHRQAVVDYCDKTITLQKNN